MFRLSSLRSSAIRPALQRTAQSIATTSFSRSLSTAGAVFQHAKQADSSLFARLAVGGATVAAFGWASHSVWSAEEDKSNRKLIAKKYADVSPSRLTKYRKEFVHFASVKDEDGKLYLTKQDFLNCISPDLESLDVNKKKFEALFDLIFDPKGANKTGLMTFEDFVNFNEMLRKPDAEYEIAFKIVDVDRTGTITREEFKRVISANLDEDCPPFNWDSDWVQLFFGKKGEGQLSYEEFTQMLKGLATERIRQEFRYYDKEETGLINGQQFEKIINHVKLRVPPMIREKVRTVENLNAQENGRKGVSYAQFVAFNNLLLHIPSYSRVLRAAIKRYGEEKINKKQFLTAAQDATTIEITPMEVDLIFHFFDVNKDGYLDFGEFETVMEKERILREEQAKANKAAKVVVQKQEERVGPTTFESVIAHIKEGVAHFGLGAIAGGIGATAVYPIDLVKTRMQNQRTLIGQTSRLYDNSLDCFRKTIKNEGFRGLYRGLGPQLVGVAPEKAIKLTVNDLLRKLFGNSERGDIYLPLEILAGGGAGASQVIFTNPLEIIKIRLQVQGELAKQGIVEKVGAMGHIRELGFFGLYKGAGACLLRDIPFSAMYFPLYAKMKTILADDEGHVGAKALLISGAVAGIPAAGLSTPADVIKTRLQVKVRAGDIVYTGIRDCFWKVLAAEGPKAFWKGAVARIFRSSPQFGVTLLSYELLQRYLLPESFNVPYRPPTNVPINPAEMESAFKQRRVLTKLEKVEKNWFAIYADADSKKPPSEEEVVSSPEA